MGKQEVEVDTPIKDENGNVIGMEKVSAYRNVWKIEVLSRHQETTLPISPDEQKTPHTQPDVEALSQANNIKAQSSMPTTGQIETSPKADTDVDVPLDQIGQGNIPGEVINQTNELKIHALATAKSTYDQKVAHLSKPDKEKLKFFERSTKDAIRDLNGEDRNQAMKNYYENMSEKMNGNTLNLPAPQQVPSPKSEPSKASDKTQDQEIER